MVWLLCKILYMPSDAAPSILPTIPLSGMTEKTKDWLIAHSGGVKSISEVIRDLLNSAAIEEMGE